MAGRPKKVKIEEVTPVVEEVAPVEVQLELPYVVTLANDEVLSINGGKPVKYPAGTYEVSKEVYVVLSNSGRI